MIGCDDGEDAVLIRRSLNEAGIGIGIRGGSVADAEDFRERAPGRATSRLNSVAVAEALVQERSIWLTLTGVATKFTGAAGKTVAKDSFEGSETCSPSTARTRYMNVTPSSKLNASVALAAPVGERFAWTGVATGSPFSRAR